MDELIDSCGPGLCEFSSSRSHEHDAAVEIDPKIPHDGEMQHKYREPSSGLRTAPSASAGPVHWEKTPQWINWFATCEPECAVHGRRPKVLERYIRP